MPSSFTVLLFAMDPWTILQVAASILQFVDVGCRIVSSAKEVYESADGA